MMRPIGATRSFEWATAWGRPALRTGGPAPEYTSGRGLAGQPRSVGPARPLNSAGVGGTLVDLLHQHVVVRTDAGVHTRVVGLGAALTPRGDPDQLAVDHQRAT